MWELLTIPLSRLRKLKMLMGNASAARSPVIMMILKIRLEKVSNRTESRLRLLMKQHPLLQMICLLTTLLRFVDARGQVVVILIDPRSNPWLSKVIRPYELTSDLTTITTLWICWSSSCTSVDSPLQPWCLQGYREGHRVPQEPYQVQRRWLGSTRSPQQDESQAILLRLTQWH